MSENNVGQVLLDQLIENLDFSISDGLRTFLAARFDDMYQAGFFSNNQIAFVLLGNGTIKNQLEASGINVDNPNELGVLVGQAKEDSSIDEPNNNEPGVTGQIFTLTAIPSEVIQDDQLTWNGYDAYAILEYIDEITDLDLVDLNIINQDGTIGTITVEGIDYNPQNGDLTLNLHNGNNITTRPDVDVAYIGAIAALFNGLLVGLDPAQPDQTVYQGIVLTPTMNNGGSFEDGFTSDANDTIIVGRPELLQGAYLDGGGGYNVLEVDMKGAFAQPLQLLNIQEVRVNNLPNVYPADQTLPDPNDPNNVIHFPHVGFPALDGTNNSFLDLSRARDLEKIVITESNFNFGGNPIGDLTIFGITNGATARLEGGFAQDVFLHYGQGLGDAINLELNINTDATFNLNVAQNSPTVNIDSQGGENIFRSADFGSNLRELNIKGDAFLYIDQPLNFVANRPASIDASANTAGVQFTIGVVGAGHDDIHFVGSTGSDRLTVVDGEDVVIVNAEGNNVYDIIAEDVTITDGDGNSVFVVFSDDIAITSGDGNNQYVVEGEIISITAGSGNNFFRVAGTDADAAAGNGVLLNIDAGAGENMIYLGAPAGEPLAQGITAMHGSVIAGENITLFVRTTSDLAFADLQGDISSVMLYPGEVLTLSEQQFAALGADVFQGYQGRQVDLNIIVSENFNLSTMVELENLNPEVKLNFFVEYGATLTMTAEQLHTYLADPAIIMGNGPGESPGKVVIEKAGPNFVFDDNTEVDYPGIAYGMGGTIVNNWPNNHNIKVWPTYDGFDRPSADEYSDYMVLDSSEGALSIGANLFGADDQYTLNQVPNLVMTGDNDITFTAPIFFGQNDFTIDFSNLTGELLGGGDIDFFTIADFHRIATAANPDDWGWISGNGNTRINVEINGDVAAGPADQGLKSQGVETFVVTDLNGGQHDFWVCDNTRDLDTLGLQGNQGARVTFQQVNRGVDLLMEGDGYANYSDQPKALGNPDQSNIGELWAVFAWDGATANVTINNQGVPLGEASDGSDRVFHVDGMSFENAKNLNVTVEDGSAIIGSLDDNSLMPGTLGIENVTIVSENDVVVQGNLAFGGNLASFDASGVLGTFTLHLTDYVTATDLSEVDISGINQVLFGLDMIPPPPAPGAPVPIVELTLTADQLAYDIGIANISTVDRAENHSRLHVVDLGGQEIDLSSASLDVDEVGTVTIADVDGTVTLHANTVLGDGVQAAQNIVLQALTSDTRVEMTAEQFNQIQGAAPTVNIDADTDPATGGDFIVTLAITDLAEDVVLDLTGIHTDIMIAFHIENYVAGEDSQITLQANSYVTLELVGENDLTEMTVGPVGVVFDGEVLFAADGAGLTITETQLAVIGEDKFAMADGVTDGTLNITDVSNGFDLDLDEIQEAGVNIGTITLDDSVAVVTFGPNATLGGADEIYVPEGVTLNMTAEQFMQLGGVGTVVGEGILNITNLTQDESDIDLSGVTAVNGHIDLGNDAEAALLLDELADLAGFSIRLYEDIANNTGQTIIFSEEGQADGRVITVWIDDVVAGGLRQASIADGDNPNNPAIIPIINNTNIAWLFNDITLNDGKLDTVNYNQFIGKLWVNDELVDGQNVEELWTYLYSAITVRVVNTADLDEALLPPINRTVVIESFTDLSGGLIFDDQNELQFVQNLTIDLGGMVDLGNIVIDNSANNPTFIANDKFQGLTIISGNGDLDPAKYYPEDWDADLHATVGDYVDAVNKVGDIHLAETSTNSLLNVTINTQGLAVEVGTITYASNPNPAGVLTLAGNSNITIAAVDFSDVDVTLLTVNNDTGAGVEVIIGGYEYTAYDTVYMMDNHVAEAGDEFGVVADFDLIEVVNGDVDLTEVLITDFNVDELYVSGDSTITMTAAQVFGIGVTEFSVAAGVNVTLNITDLSNQELDLNVLQDAGFNIGDITILEEYQGALHADTTLGGAAQIILQDEDTELSLTAAQFMGLEGPGTIVGPGTVNITDLTNDESDIDLSEVSAVNGMITLDEADVTLGTWDEVAGEWVDAAVLNGFSVDLTNLGPFDAPFAGQTIRFVNPDQAEREITTTGVDNTSTNVVWLFTSLADKVDTSDYAGTLGRLWLLDELVDGANVEELFTTLSGDITIRVVNSADLAELLPASAAFDRTVEIEAFTQLPGGLVFSDEDLLQHVQNLTLQLGGQVNMGDLLLDNILAVPVAGNDNFQTLTIESHFANNQNHFLIPEDWDPVVNPQPLGANVIGDIDSGPTRDQLLTVVLDTLTPATGRHLEVETITFAGAAGAFATLTVNGDNNVTVKSVDTTDPLITTLTINNLGGGATLVTGGSPAAAVSDTEVLTINAETGSLLTLGSMVDPDDPDAGFYAGVYGPELSTINIFGDGTVNLGVVAAIDGSIVPVVSPAGFVFTAGGGVNTMTLGEAIVDGAPVAPELGAGEAWTFAYTGADTVSWLAITEDVDFNGGNLTMTMGAAELMIYGHVDFRDLDALTYTSTTGEVVLVDGATLQMTHDQWLTSGFVGATFVDENGDPATLQVTADLVAEIGNDLTEVFGYANYEIEDGVAVTLRKDQADVAYPEGEDPIADAGDLSNANVTVVIYEDITASGEFGDKDITNLVGVDALILEEGEPVGVPPAPVPYEVTMTVEQADSLVGDITKNGNLVRALGGDTDPDGLVDGDAMDLTDPEGDGSEPAYDLSEVDNLEIEDPDGTIINLTQLQAIQANAGIITKTAGDLVLLADGDLTGVDLTDVDQLLLTGDTTLTMEQVDDLDSIDMDDPGAAYTLDIEDVEQVGDDLNDDGFIDVGSDIPIDLSHVTVATVNAEMSTVTTDPADGITQIDGQFAVTGDLNGATLTLLGNGTVTMDVTVANGETITGVNATLNLTDVANQDDDFNGTEIHLENIAAAIAGVATLSENAVLHVDTNLGSFEIAAAGFNLEGTAAQLSGVTVTNAFDVEITDLGEDEVDLGDIEGTNSVTAFLIDDGATADITLDPNTVIGDDFTIDSAGTVDTFTFTAEQADGTAVTNGGALADVIVTNFELKLDADLSGIPGLTWDTDVQLNSTGNVQISAGADLSFINAVNNAQVTISGPGTVTIQDETAAGAGDGANVSATDFVVNAGSTLVSNNQLGDANAIVDIGNVSGAGKLQAVADQAGTYGFTQDVKFTELVVQGTDDSIVITGFEAIAALAGGYLFDPGGLDEGIGRHTINLNKGLVDVGNNVETGYEEIAAGVTKQFEGNTGLVMYTGNDFGTTSGTTDENAIEDLFNTTEADMSFVNVGDTLYLAASDGNNTFIYLIEDTDGDGTFTAAGDDATLIVTLVGVDDVSDLNALNFVGFA